MKFCGEPSGSYTFAFHASRVPGHAWRAVAHGAPLQRAPTHRDCSGRKGAKTHGVPGNTEKDNPHSYFNHKPNPTTHIITPLTPRFIAVA
eukprot:scaffold56130_cov47-Phaeocystis_antarctica.AAC.2